MQYRSTLLNSAAICLTVAASSAFSQTEFVGGHLTLSESAEAAYLWNSSPLFRGGSTSSADGSTSIVTSALGAYNNQLISTAITDQPIESVTRSGEYLASISSPNAGFVLQGRAFVGQPGSYAPYAITVKNLSLDFADSTIYADIYTAQGSYLHQSFLVPVASFYMNSSPADEPEHDGLFHTWGGGAIEGWKLGGTWDAQSGQATGTLAIFSNAVMPSSTYRGAVASQLSRLHYADVWFDVGFAAAVPEPSTYALMLAGLACMGFAARKRLASA